MKRIVILSACLFLLFSVGQAHEEKPGFPGIQYQKKALEFGVNGSFFINNFFNITGLDEPVFQDPFGLSLKYLHGRWAFRAGGNFVMNNFESKSALTGASTRGVKTHNYTYRIGFERQTVLNKRWKVYYGIDFIGEDIYDFNEFQNSVETVTSEIKSVGFGAGPILGFQYYFTDRLSLFTETGLYRISTTGKSVETFSVNWRRNSSVNQTTNELRFVMPTSIFVAVRLTK